MAEIKLTATLRAYSKTPFYNDFIRDIYSQQETSSNTIYVRTYKEVVDSEGNINNIGEWVPLDVSTLDKPLEEYNQELSSLKESINKISIKIDNKTNALIFTDSLGRQYITYLPEAQVDGTTIKLNDDHKAYIIDTPDGETLKISNIIYKNGVGEDGIPIADPNTGIIEKLSGKIRVEGIYVKDIDSVVSANELYHKLQTIEKNVADLEEYTQGTGGFLDPYNFNVSLSTLDNDYKNSLLNQEAYNQLSGGNPELIPDQTKIKNLFDKHIWIYIQDANNWVDDGADSIVQASNDGVLGAVTGSKENLKGYINADGTISINNLKEEFSRVIYTSQASVDAVNDSYVKRSTTGQIKARDPEAADDVTTLGYLEAFYASNKITDEQIDSLFGGNN